MTNRPGFPLTDVRLEQLEHAFCHTDLGNFRQECLELILYVQHLREELRGVRLELEKMLSADGEAEVYASKLCALIRQRDQARGEVERYQRENADLSRQIEGHCKRIAAQSELLTRRAEL